MDELAAHRRRVWLAMIMVVGFGLLVVAALIPSPGHRPLQLEQAGADETVPASPVTTAAPAPTTTEAPAPTTTTTDAPRTATTEEPATTTTTEVRAKATSVTVRTPVTPTPVVTTPPPPPPVPPSEAAFLACIRMRESHNNYTAVSSSGNYRGAYQFNQSAWDTTARHAGRLDLVGRLANEVSPADQDALALDLYRWQGAKPWNGACT